MPLTQGCGGMYQAAAAAGDTQRVEQCLEVIAASVADMTATLGRMYEKCDPHIYYERVRMPCSGWRNNPALPHGLLYEGMAPPTTVHKQDCIGALLYFRTCMHPAVLIGVQKP